MSGSHSSSTPPAERLLNLVIALVNAPVRMTKEQIRASVAGYDQPTPEAFERTFERDKAHLRNLGIPLLTVTDAAHGDDQGYRIDADAWSLPPIELDAAQLGVLTLAAGLWSDKNLRTDAQRALTKLRVVGETPSADDVVAGLTPQVHPAGPALESLIDAVQERRVVTFTYRTASTGDVRDRHVEPWRVVAARGGWYLVGHDRDREAPRVFRLSRISGPVRNASGPDAFTVPDDVDPLELVTTSQRASEGTAWLAVAPGRAGALRARALPDVEPGDDVPAVPDGLEPVAVRYAREADMADELVAYTDAVVVLAPPSLRDAVVDRLRAAVALADRVAGPEGPTDG